MKTLYIIILTFLVLSPSQIVLAKDLEDYKPSLALQLVKEKGALLIDVRSEGEFKSGSIPGAVHIPHKNIRSQVKSILNLQKGDKDKPIVVFCAVGGRAGKAKKDLLQLGFTQVTNMGGVKDWPRSANK